MAFENSDIDVGKVVITEEDRSETEGNVDGTGRESTKSLHRVLGLGRFDAVDRAFSVMVATGTDDDDDDDTDCCVVEAVVAIPAALGVMLDIFAADFPRMS